MYANCRHCFNQKTQSILDQQRQQRMRLNTDAADPVCLFVSHADTFTDKFVGRALIHAARAKGKTETNRAVGDSSGSYCISDSPRTQQEEEEEEEEEEEQREVQNH